jgi:hypothetical protein
MLCTNNKSLFCVYVTFITTNKNYDHEVVLYFLFANFNFKSDRSVPILDYRFDRTICFRTASLDQSHSHCAVVAARQES